jgi:hypothetical protein
MIKTSLSNNLTAELPALIAKKNYPLKLATKKMAQKNCWHNHVSMFIQGLNPDYLYKKKSNIPIKT